MIKTYINKCLRFISSPKLTYFSLKYYILLLNIIHQHRICKLKTISYNILITFIWIRKLLIATLIPYYWVLFTNILLLRKPITIMILGTSFDVLDSLMGFIVFNILFIFLGYTYIKNIF
jgi:hypothetical protein